MDVTSAHLESEDNVSESHRPGPLKPRAALTQCTCSLTTVTTTIFQRRALRRWQSKVRCIRVPVADRVGNLEQCDRRRAHGDIFAAWQ